MLESGRLCLWLRDGWLAEETRAGDVLRAGQGGSIFVCPSFYNNKPTNWEGNGGGGFGAWQASGWLRWASAPMSGRSPDPSPTSPYSRANRAPAPGRQVPPWQAGSRGRRVGGRLRLTVCPADVLVMPAGWGGPPG